MSTLAARPVTAGRAVPVVPVVLASTSVALCLVSLVAVTRASAWGLPAARELPVDLAVGVSYAAAAVLVLAGSGGRRVGSLMLVIGLAASGAAAATTAALLADESTPAAELAVFLQSWLWVPGFVPLLTLVPLLYPDGRLPGRRWWPALVASVSGAALLAVGTMAYPEDFVGRTTLAKPWTSEPLAVACSVAAAALLVPAAGAGLGALLLRLRRSDGLVRRQILVLLVTAALVAADTAAQPLLTWPATSLSQSVAVALVPVAMAVAITRSRLYDLDLAVCRATAGASLAVCLAGAYLSLFALTGALFPDRAAVGAGFAAAVVGLLVHPLGVRLNRGVDRLFYGERAQPGAVLARLSSGLQGGMDLGDVPAHVCAELVASLRLGAAAVVLGEDPVARPAASVGALGSATEAFALRHRGDTVGHLVVSPRAGEPRLSVQDREVLGAAGDQVAATIAAYGLAERLQASRAALVAAREEERRRLRRDLHDGLGATLAGLRLQVDSARDLAPESPVRRLLDAAAKGVGSAVADLRSVTDDLRPPALDELGLAGGLHGLADRMSTPQARVVARVDLPDALSAAVDVACYRIAAEALANAVRHSGARMILLSVVGTAGEVVVEVSDDGAGMPSTTRSGSIGLASMRQRAEELGGSLQVLSSEAGTTVRARLPRTAA